MAEIDLAQLDMPKYIVDLMSERRLFMSYPHLVDPPSSLDALIETRSRFLDEADALRVGLESIANPEYWLRDATIELIGTYVNKAERIRRGAAALVNEVTPNTDTFLRRRNQLHEEATADSKELARETRAVRVALGAARANQRLDTVGSLEDRIRDFNVVEARLNLTLEQAERAAESLKDSVFEQARRELLGGYEGLRRAHAKRQRVLLKWIWIASGALLVAGVAAYVRPEPLVQVLPNGVALPPSSIEQLHFLVRNVLLVSAPVLLLRVVLKQFNLERNLSILFAHRVTVLKEFHRFMDSIPAEDRESRERLRLTVVSMAFTDPRTGYVEERASEISVSPFLNFSELPFAKRGA